VSRRPALTVFHQLSDMEQDALARALQVGYLSWPPRGTVRLVWRWQFETQRLRRPCIILQRTRRVAKSSPMLPEPQAYVSVYADLWWVDGFWSPEQADLIKDRGRAIAVGAARRYVCASATMAHVGRARFEDAERFAAWVLTVRPTFPSEGLTA
jgi:hypothetical protein